MRFELHFKFGIEFIRDGAIEIFRQASTFSCFTEARYTGAEIGAAAILFARHVECDFSFRGAYYADEFTFRVVISTAYATPFWQSFLYAHYALISIL
jgi:hypothetical protein